MVTAAEKSLACGGAGNRFLHLLWAARWLLRRCAERPRDFPVYRDGWSGALLVGWLREEFDIICGLDHVLDPADLRFKRPSQPLTSE